MPRTENLKPPAQAILIPGQLASGPILIFAYLCGGHVYDYW